MLLNSDTLFPDKVLSVTYVKGGSAADIISPHAEFGGTLRNLTTEGMYRLQKRLHKVIFHYFAFHFSRGIILDVASNLHYILGRNNTSQHP